MTVAFAQQADVDRQPLRRFEHIGDIPGAWRHRRGVGSVRRTCTAPDQRRCAVGERRFALLRRDEMNVGVDAACGQDQMRARDCVGCEADFEARRDPVHRLRVAGLADRADPAILDPDIRLNDSELGVDDRHISDDQVGRASLARDAVVHPHAFAHALAAAEDDFIAGRASQIALNLHEEVRVAKPDPVAGRGPVHSDIFSAGELGHKAISIGEGMSSASRIEAKSALFGARHRFCSCWPPHVRRTFRRRPGC